ncbi:hypothetical protein C2845_PM15G19160 [Panicum miliaceum]|uniref:Uncharacterized protein n=1 Tax=Panicum miliaceum TaxID=4540 RepID=A0A3L6Q4L4_PANMI|nr:hypothetical protein C2845_PM15G19160 [Panicum miliaceum]
MDSPPSHPALLAPSLVLLLLLALYLARRRRGAGKNRKYPPVAGTVLHQLLNFGRLVEYQTELARRTPRLIDDFVVGLLLLQDAKCCFSDDTLPDGYAVNEGDMAGPRVCLGKEFAYRQMKVFMAVLLYLFRFELWDANATVGYRAMLTLKMDCPLHVRASLRR